MAQFTFKEFQKRFPTDNACLDRIFQLRYGHLTECPSCNGEVAWRRVRTRRCYQCRHCYAQIYPCAGTVFAKTTTPLSSWFYVLMLFTTTRNGVAGKEIQRQLGCSYKCAWRMGHQIRKLMDSAGGAEKLKGFVEMDETYVGKKGEDGTHEGGTITPVFGMVERLGVVRAWKVNNTTKDELYPIIEKNVDKNANVSTDDSNIYKGLTNELGLKHGSVNHSKYVFRHGSICTNTIEGFFGQIKRTIGGTHIHVSDKYLQNYVGECVLRYNYRKNPNGMFDAILKNLPLFSE